MTNKTIWLYYYIFDVESGEKHRFKDQFKCLASNDVQAWTQVAASTSGHNPPIDTIRLASKTGLMDMKEEEVINILKECRNH